MSSDTPLENSLEAKRKSTLRLRAVLAGGLVLGIGATVTLASWQDSEYASHQFEASTFGTESSTVTGGWASNDSAPGAALVFTGGAALPMVSQYAWINIRTTANSTTNGTVTLASSSASGTLAPELEYRAVRTPSSGTACDATVFVGSPTFIAGGAATYLPVTSVPASAVASAITSPSGQLRYCFDIRVRAAANNNKQGTTGQVTWLFSAISN
ncbi:SipW-dependent-type signal peptide-containing protein [Salinibacterium sp. NK8237]|uniref:SipW-dependent-type signal peptide-containing protein n=1 Tax=Salinibacterium sp. NK8237 TaxID=2792038 RepID=UPI0018CC9F08|nr:SipW-dependent-type signal peptide-containing protein [Salinibacterium sp. NK8237]MBH0130593.1 hypothetical protein [Salinibacterium sp. NK8237]